jgi:tetratricopeptide (TPR) repeat protein
LGTIFNRNLTKTSLPQEQLEELLEQIPGLARILNVTPTKTSAQLVAKTPKKPATASGLWQALTERVPESAARNFSETQWQFSKIILDVLAGLGPTVLFFEDATYLDEASLALVRFLVRQESLPLLFVAACRDATETPAWVHSFLADELTTLPLGPLPTPAIKDYVTSLVEGTVSDEVVTLIEERSQGIPLTIEELTRQLVESAELVPDKTGVWQRSQKEQLADAFLPQSVLRAFQRRIEQLTNSSREALALAALMEPGPEFEQTLWATLLARELPDQSPSEILEEAIKKRLLRPLREGHYAFRPPDVAKALRATLTGTRRQALHQQIAAILAEAEADPLLVAYHHEQAGSVMEAAHYLEVAGAKAMTANALKAAVTYYNRAAALGESRTAYTAMGHLYRQQGQHTEAVKAYQHTLFLAKQAGDVKDEGRILNSLSLTLCLSDQYEAARQHAQEVLNLHSVSEITRAIAQSHLGKILWLTGQLSEAEGWCRQAIDVLSQTDNEADLAEAYYRLGLIYTGQGKFNKARLALQQALKLRRELKDETGQAYCLNSLGHLLSERGDFAQATSLFTSVQKRFDQLGAQDGLVVVYLNRGRVLCYQQEPDKALALLRKAFQAAKDIGEHSAHILGDIYLLMAQGGLLQDKLDLAKAAADDALKLVEGAGNQVHIAQAKVTLAQIYTRQKDLAAAELMYKDALASFEKLGCRPGLVRAKLHYAQFLLKQLGQTIEAIPLQREAQQEAKQMELYLPV